MSAVLGVSGLYHDAAAALVVDGDLVAAVQEERFSRIKNDSALPIRSMQYCLESSGIGPGDLDAVLYYERPLEKLVRILRSSARSGPAGWPSFRRSMPAWATTKLWVGYEIERALRDLGFRGAGPVQFADHHRSHAAAAFLCSPFDRAAILTFDGVGEWTTASMGRGQGGEVELMSQIQFPDSLGLLYSAVTAYCGFAVNSGEYKLMGLAPYGEPVFADRLLDEVIDVRPDGSFHLNQRYFSYISGRRMFSRRLVDLFGQPARQRNGAIRAHDADVAASVQSVVEQVVLRSAATAHRLTGERDVCLAGGVALNCVANGRLLREGPFDRLWVQPAAGDAGSAIGAALIGWHEVLGHPRRADPADGMHGSYLGPAVDAEDVPRLLEAEGVAFERLDAGTRGDRIAALLASGAIVGVVQGRMEFGPRALGHRSILADPRDPSVHDRLNRSIKEREPFRPFAPAVLAEHADAWFDLGGSSSPYMTVTAPVLEQHRIPVETETDLERRAVQIRSSIPAVTHVDHSARVQTVDADRSPLFHAVLTAFHDRTGCPVVLNTSFNGADEPIVCSAADALRTFAATGLDALVVEDHLVLRSGLPEHDLGSIEPPTRRKEAITW